VLTLPWLLWAFPVAALACAVALARGDANIWTKLWAWIGVMLSLLLSWGLFNFHGI
jgi:hypothetical protein